MKKLLLAFCFVILLALPSESMPSRPFDGTDDEIDYGNVLNVTTGNVTVCANFQTTEDASRDHLVGKKDNDAGAGYRLYQTSGDLIAFQVTGSSQTSVSSGGDYDGVWIHTCGTWDGTAKTTRILVNGVEEATHTNGSVGSLTITSNMNVGESHADDDDANARIAHVQVFLRIITDVEINEVRWFPERIVSNAYWPLMGNSPEIDLSGNGRTGTVSGTAGSTTDGPKTIIYGGGLPL